ncbi:hypothetical protein HPB48_009160 [Haemaphysalis longicornis]|uniref:SKP1 component POZ domain-containing protein n=1 Tax=Haemaphysalis longicornis TaxID=44386 RepID=A0A9J6GF25_HAELO|nr:hypothetical protein HPB48_009160 [Haemaphysalis longicornis]
MSTIKLKSSEGDVFLVDIEITNTSQTIKDLLKSENVQNDNTVVPLDACNDGTGKPPCAGHTSWEAAFFDLRLVPTLELLKGALYLQMEGLIDSASKALNALVERMTPEQLSAEYYATAVPDRVREAQGADASPC